MQPSSITFGSLRDDHKARRSRQLVITIVFGVRHQLCESSSKEARKLSFRSSHRTSDLVGIVYGAGKI